jgi:hypothetical protein
MSNKEVVQIGSKIYLFPRLPYETDEIYFSRKTFVIKVAPKTEKKFIDTVRLSMIWANIKFLKCSYPSNVMTDLRKILPNNV